MLTDSLVQRLKRRFKAAQTDLSFLILHKSQHGPLVISLGGNTAPRVQNPLHVFFFAQYTLDPTPLPHRSLPPPPGRSSTVLYKETTLFHRKSACLSGFWSIIAGDFFVWI